MLVTSQARIDVARQWPNVCYLTNPPKCVYIVSPMMLFYKCKYTDEYLELLDKMLEGDAVWFECDTPRASCRLVELYELTMRTH